jgi:hypothetical protein
MTRLLSIVLALLLGLMCATSFAKPAAMHDLGDVVLELPEDGQLYHTLLFTSEHWQQNPKERDFIAWFDTNPQLKKLCAQTHVHHYEANQLRYRYRFDDIVKDDFPCIIVQRCDGCAVFKMSGSNMPRNSAVLAGKLSSVLDRLPDQEPALCVTRSNYRHDGLCGRIFDRPKPRPDDKPCPGPNCPTPTPVAPTTPTTNVVPDITGDEEEFVDDPADTSIGVVLALIGLGAVVGTIVMFKART